MRFNLKEKVCANCGKTYRSTRQKYCSSVCKKELNARQVTRAMHDGLTTASIGAMHELIACADLLRRGWSVFRAVSPSCKCDLVIMKGTWLLRVEVTSGHIYKPSGRLSYVKKPDDYQFEVLAVVLPEGTVQYTPGLPQEVTEAAQEPQVVPEGQ